MESQRNVYPRDQKRNAAKQRINGSNSVIIDYTLELVRRRGVGNPPN